MVHKAVVDMSFVTELLHVEVFKMANELFDMELAETKRINELKDCFSLYLSHPDLVFLRKSCLKNLWSETM